MATTVKPAPVRWAQRGELVYLNFEVQDVENPQVSVEKDKVTYKATTKDKQQFETVLNLFGTVDPSESKWINRDRGAEFILMKTEVGPYWKRLLKEDTKYHWLKVDFNRWKDESDSEDEGGAGGGGTNFEEMMRQMGGLGGAGGGMGANPYNELDDLDVEDEKDSDDENIPELEEEKTPASNEEKKD